MTSKSELTKNLRTEKTHDLGNQRGIAPVLGVFAIGFLLLFLGYVFGESWFMTELQGETRNGHKVASFLVFVGMSFSFLANRRN